MNKANWGNNIMKSEKYMYTGKGNLHLNDYPTNSKEDDVDKQEIIAKFEENIKEIDDLQEALYANGKEGIIVILQAIDAAGKDSTIKRVFSGLNPQGVTVSNFKQPNTDELSHDYLWRFNKVLPRRGEIAVFNRSYYEDVVTVSVHDIQKSYSMANRVLDVRKSDFFNIRYKQIQNYEEYLYENSYRLLKIFLHVSKDTQRKRFLERIDKKEKKWKFNPNDLRDRELFDKIMNAYEKAFENTSTETNPWYIIPADQKWYTRYLFSEVLLKTMQNCDTKFPTISQETLDEMQKCREILIHEGPI